MEQRASPNICSMPDELLLTIIRHVDPEDIFGLKGTCKRMYGIIKGNKRLYREALRGFVDKTTNEFYNAANCDWEERHRDIVVLRAIFHEYNHPVSELFNSSDDSNAGKRLLLVTQKCIDLIHAASPASNSQTLQFLARNFNMETYQGKTFIEEYFCQSTLYQRAKYDLNRDLSMPGEVLSQHFKQFGEPLRQLSAQLHCYYGVPVTNPDPDKYGAAYPYAISIVYDMRKYTDDTLWGPYLPDRKASVDWEKMEAIMVVLGHNLRCFDEETGRQFRPVWRKPWQGCVRDSFRSVSLKAVKEDLQEGEFELEKNKSIPPELEMAEDPYNVAGTWMRIVTFLDYHELASYNFVEPDYPADQPRPSFKTTEAIRLIVMELEVTSIKASRTPGQEFPLVSFKGVSRSLHSPHDPNANSNIKGCVCMTQEGEVRWRTVSVYNGEERWKSEGIQVGGIRSARGVFGNWFDKDMDNEQGPAGPTAFWKVSNDIDNETTDEWVEPWASDEDDDDDDDDDDFVDEEPLFLHTLSQQTQTQQMQDTATIIAAVMSAVPQRLENSEEVNDDQE